MTDPQLRQLAEQWLRAEDITARKDGTINGGNGYDFHFDELVELLATFASHTRREALREAEERRWTDQDVYDAYLMGCEDECLPEPLDKGTFLATLDDIEDVK